ncbi:ATP:guanido phosphotransferase, C-terminal catalytic domain protein [Mageeibacillus indolicus UPII9-5]|uniref:ATP:guanido phosphotransferase, C-terminal catalytic domain protein n=1 Tax=Mageeibacillus indolicus (strain UPII9-5) TaxID=699246 RepID=D3R0U5_MAGIU|nr:ATP--guanido phosphotransferase [Mageeibacillus indolicus]ADC91625.1 ATP:guanido phosphotransferase, C-terminal catalytic domain protein [Mageeibacillus indolicus UPII9-5]
MAWYLEDGPESDVVISSRIRLARNVRGYPFPELLLPGTAKECYDRISKAFFSANEAMRRDYVEIVLADVPELTVNSLVEKRLLSEDMLNKRASGRAIIRRDEAVSIMLGEEDHIRIQSMQAGLNLVAAYEEAEKISLLLEEKLPLAFKPEFGFLTACPTNVGTGMRASVMVHLPALGRTKLLEKYLDSCRKAGLAVRGQYGENSEATGFVFQISNQMTLGLDESTAIKELQTVVEQLIKREHEARQYLWKNNRYEIEDQIYRSYGVLSEARLISTEAAQLELSNLRWGMALGILPQLKPVTVNRLEVRIGSATLQREAGEVLPTRERDYRRAALIRQALAEDAADAAGAAGAKPGTGATVAKSAAGAKSTADAKSASAGKDVSDGENSANGAEVAGSAPDAGKEPADGTNSAN